MPENFTVAEQLLPLLQQMLGTKELPLRLRAWDGSEVGPVGKQLVVVGHKRVLQRLFWQPNELGIARAFVAGELEITGDLYELLKSIALMGRTSKQSTNLSTMDRIKMLLTVVHLGAVGWEPKPPPEEVGNLNGEKHSTKRDKEAISHHYDVGNSFFRIVLGPSMVYSCAYYTRPDDPKYTLEDAQYDKLELICRKLALKPGQRLLDIGCGWGSMVIHAARHYGVKAVGVTISKEQAELGRQRVMEAGLKDLVEIRLQDYREVSDGPYDAISSIGMAEHVGTEKFLEYCQIMHDLLKPGGRLLNHQISSRYERDMSVPSFIGSYVFPDGDLLPVGDTITLLEDAELEVRDVESLRENYGRTLRAWVKNLEDHWEECIKLTTDGRCRVWRLYMAACALAFEVGRIGINQVLAVRPLEGGKSNMPPTREDLVLSATAATT